METLGWLTLAAVIGLYGYMAVMMYSEWNEQ